MITGEICARELKILYRVNVSKCPLQVDKQRIEFPALPQNENKEVVLEVKNTSLKNLLMELVPPNFQISGLIVNPLVVPLQAGRSSLVSIKFHSNFRDFSAQALEDMYKPKLIGKDGEELIPKGMVARNRKIAERLEKKKKEQDSAQAADPKKKGLPPAPVKKEEVKKEAPLVIPKGKTA